ncbi:MAG: hypothetical protein DSZ23_02565 [Thermodesulfatator sp.]|nr:MAG: hypothetical protein DSZ23_02565 [Thermodesulfatator sp.]
MEKRTDISMNSSLSYRHDNDSPDGHAGPIKLLLDLVIRLNEVFVKARELNEILNAVLAGTTSGDGLGFNRAFLFLVDREKQVLQGRFGLGPHSAEDAGRIWSEIDRCQVGLFQILDGIRDQLLDESHPMNVLARSITISLDDEENILVRSLARNQAYIVTPEAREGTIESREMCEQFGTNEFAVAPLYSHGEEYGVVVADYLYTGKPITYDHLYCLHLFSGLASIALCQSKMCRTLEDRMEELKSVNRAVEEQKNLLIETEKFSAIGKMLDRLLHEMRNPLSAIGGISRLLRRREDDENKLAYLDAIIKEADKIEETLLHLAELQDSGPMSWELVDLTSLVDLMALMVKSDLEELGVALHQNYTPDEILVRADRERLKQAVLYIIKNSLEAMPDGGILVIAISRKGSDVELRISDSGLGIARGHFKKVDNPFFTTKLNSLGLGLSKAKQIVEAHNGVLALSTNRIGGTTCSITLPRVINSQ